MSLERAPFGLPFPTAKLPKKILIVEDHNDARHMLTVALRKLGFEVHGTASSMAALKAVREKKPDIVLLDIGLADGQSGLLVCEKIKAKNASVSPYVIITSGHKSKDIVQEAQRLGADAYLVKPFRLSRLLEIITAADVTSKDFIVEWQ